jgi:hypothetical protein
MVASALYMDSSPRGQLQNVSSCRNFAIGKQMYPTKKSYKPFNNRDYEKDDVFEPCVLGDGTWQCSGKRR